ncbi:hypothetical protein [Streptomyces sp. NPDC006307]|uniref:hypothetical protein n=1 Tax=Streptomyces sp. NPDC006307 TaxID=3156748 RepID=UPI0033B7FEA9
MEALVVIDEGWSRIRRAWGALHSLGEAYADERARAVAQAEPGRKARHEALEGLPSEAAFLSARADFTRLLADLADAYERFPLRQGPGT